MSAVDERVVEMRFDNKQFEKNIKDSIKSLDDLDKQLGLLDDNDSFENIEKSSKKLDFSNLTEGVGELGAKFNWLEKIATGALLRIGSKITDIVSRYAGQLTFQQIGAGWNKYADYSTATQTTMAATHNTWEDEANGVERLNYLLDELGDKSKAEAINNTFEAFEKGETNIRKASKALNMTQEQTKELFNTLKEVETDLTQEEYVEKYIEKLNWYSDETSYNFTDMVSTLSKFTGAGQTLKDASTAIEGMMNMVAVAGGNAAVGQRVSYNLSQAMGAGALTTIDFKSLENANVATVEFKQTLLETAAEMGVITKVSGEGADAIYKYGNTTMSATEGFRDSLSKKWVTSNVLQKTLEEYGKFSEKIYEFTDTYGMTAREAMSEVDAYAAAMAENADPKVIDEWHDHVQEKFDGDIERIADYEKMLEELSDDEMAFSRRAFEEAQAAKTFRDAIDATADAVSTKWMNIFKYVFGSSERAKEFWSNFTETLYEIFAGPLDAVLDIFEKVNKLNNIWDSDSKTWINSFEAFRRGLDNIQAGLLSVIGPIRDAFGEVFLSNAARNISNLLRSFLNFTKGLILGEDAANNLKRVFRALFNIVKLFGRAIGSVFKIIKPIFNLIGPIARLVGTIVISILRLITALVGMNEAASENSGFIGFINGIADAVGAAVEFISGALDSLSDWISKHINIEEAQKKFKDLRNVLVKVWGDIKKAVSGAWDKIKEFLHIDDVTAALDSFWQTVQGFLPTWEEFLAGLQAGWDTFKHVGIAIWEFISPYLTQLWNSLKTLWSRVSGFIDGFLKAENKWEFIKENVQGIVDAFVEWKKNSKFINFIIKSFESLKETINKVKDSLTPKEGEEGGAGGRLFGILYLVASLASLYLILRNVDRITTGFTNITKAIKKFSGFLNKVALFVGLYLIIKALSDLVEAVTLFSTLPWHMVAVGVAAVGLMMFGIGLLGSHIRKITKDMSAADAKALQKTCLSLAAVLLSIAGALWIVANAPGTNEDVFTRALTLLVTLAVAVGMVYVLSQMHDKIDFKALGALALIGGVIFVAALAIEKLAKIPTADIESAKQVILAMGLAIAAVMVIGNFLKNGSEALKNIGFAVAALAASVLIIVLALSKLQGLTVDWQVAALLLTVIAILGVISAVPLYLAKFMKKFDISSKDMFKMATLIGSMTICLIAIAITLGLLVKGIKKSGATVSDILAIGLVLGVMMLCLGMLADFTAKAVTEISKENGGTEMKKAAKSIRSMVVSLLLIVAAIVILTKMNLSAGKVVGAFAIIILAAGLIAGMLYLLALANNGLNGGSKIEAGVIIATTLSVVAIIAALVILSKFLEKEGNKIWKAFGVFAAVSGVFALLMLFIGGATKLAGGKIQIGPILVIMLGIIAIMHMLILMSAADQTALRKSAVSVLIIIGALAALVAAVALLSKFSSSTGNMLRSLAMLTGVVAAIFMIAKVMQQLQGVKVPTETVVQMGVLLAGLLVVVTLLGWLATATGAGLGVIAIAGGLVLISVAIIGLALAAKIAASALPELATGMQKVFDVIAGITATNDQITAFSKILWTLATAGTIAMIGMGAGALIMAAGFYVGALALSLVSGILPELSEGILILADALVSINNNVGPIIGSAWALAAAFLGLMLGGIFLGVGLAAAGVGLGIVSLAAMGLATAILLASLGVSTLVLSLAMLAEGIALVIDLFKGGDISGQVSTFTDSVKSGASGITQSVSELKTELGGESGGLLESILGGGEGGFDISGLKENLMGNLTGENGLFSGDFSSMISGDLLGGLTDGIDGMDMSQLTGAFGDQFAGMDFGTIMAENGVGDNMMAGIFSGVSEEGMQEPANELVEEFADTLGSNESKSKAKSAGGSVGQAGSAGASATRGSWYSSGTYCAQGLIDGVASKIKASDLIGTKLANALIQACREQLEMHSPSRVFYGIGEYVVEGLANGISDNTGMAITSVQDMAKDSIAAATEMLAAAIENDYASPVIAPVLDLSNVARGASAISSMFGNNRIGVDGELQNEDNRASGITYNYTQNNYSPKPLSRIEIYRQTRNQLSTLSV